MTRLRNLRTASKRSETEIKRLETIVCIMPTDLLESWRALLAEHTELLSYLGTMEESE